MALEGDLVVLREERLEDQTKLVGLRNDLQTQAWNYSLPPDYTLEMYVKQFEAREFSYNPRAGHFIIEMRETGEFAGMIRYSNLQGRLRTSIGIMVDKAFWGTGVAWDAQEILLNFLFVELGLRLVCLYTHSGNPRAIALAEKAGFTISMRQREAAFKNGKLLDNIYMDMTREEYFEAHPDLTDTLPGIQ